MLEQRLSAEEEGSIRRTVKAKYRAVAERTQGTFPNPVGRDSALNLGYESRRIESIPAGGGGALRGSRQPLQDRSPAQR